MFIDNYMRIFMFLLEKYLLNNVKDLCNISFQSDEANTDRPLKEFIKDFIINNLKKIPEDYYNFNLLIYNEKIGVSERIPFGSFKNVIINNVYLPDEISEEIKKRIKQSRHKDIVYTNPDLLLELLFEDQLHYKSIELKSTKEDSIPGSSVQQVNPSEWVIFVKHKGKNIDVATGQYLNSINSKIQFPDRSPRPQVSFSELKKWNSENRTFDKFELNYMLDVEHSKIDLLNDWQKVLAERWVEILFSKTKSKKEPWFNNNLRKFILLFLSKYDLLGTEEKEEFKKNITNLID